MNVVRFRLPMLIPLLAVFAPVARAQEADNPWKMEVFGGDSIGMRGSLSSPLSVALPNAGTLSPSLEGESAALGLNRMRFDDIFHPKYSAGTELSYALNPDMQAYGRFGYDSFRGDTRNVGVLTTESGAVAPVAITGDTSPHGWLAYARICAQLRTLAESMSCWAITCRHRAGAVRPSNLR